MSARPIGLSNLSLVKERNNDLRTPRRRSTSPNRNARIAFRRDRQRTVSRPANGTRFPRRNRLRSMKASPGSRLTHSGASHSLSHSDRSVALTGCRITDNPEKCFALEARRQRSIAHPVTRSPYGIEESAYFCLRLSRLSTNRPTEGIQQDGASIEARSPKEQDLKCVLEVCL